METLVKQTKNDHATTIHYNNEIDFFKSFLDPYMKYTSGLFYSEKESLEQAAINMLDRIIVEAKLPNNASILEIGSGWGSLIRRLRDKGINAKYTGLSPSKKQNDMIRQLKHKDCNIIDTTLEDWNNKDELFDAIFLVGSYCHLKDKLAQLARLANMLKPNGKIIIEDTFFINEDIFQKHKDHPSTQYVQKTIFGFAEIPSLSWQTEAIAKSGLRLSNTFEHSDSYKETIRRWIDKLSEMDRERYPSVDSYIQYMSIAQKGWRKTTLNYLMVLEKAQLM